MDDRLPESVRSRISPCPNTGCWFWMGSDTGKGHGQVRFGGRWLVHRLVWTLMRGPICSWLVLDHMCRMRACVNPDHLEPVTTDVNTARGNGVLTQFKKRVDA